MAEDERPDQERTAHEFLRKYSTRDLTVYWNPNLCAHPGYCWRGLPNVFNPARRPWVDMQAASPVEIIKTVDTCPTGALVYELPEGSEVDPELARGPGWVHYKQEEPAIAKIKIIKNGPLMVDGQSEVYDSGGNLIKKYHQFAFCRCGFSANKPFCDGAHLPNRWKDE